MNFICVAQNYKAALEDFTVQTTWEIALRQSISMNYEMGAESRKK